MSVNIYQATRRYIPEDRRVILVAMRTSNLTRAWRTPNMDGPIVCPSLTLEREERINISLKLSRCYGDPGASQGTALIIIISSWTKSDSSSKAIRFVFPCLLLVRSWSILLGLFLENTSYEKRAFLSPSCWPWTWCHVKCLNVFSMLLECYSTFVWPEDFSHRVQKYPFRNLTPIFNIGSMEK
jgi:hypothetical protein